MKNLLQSFQHFFRDYFRNESGATAIEYGLIAAAIALVLVSAGSTFSEKIGGKFADIAQSLTPPEEEKPTGNFLPPAN